MKRALHFATKLNSRDIQKCNCFGYPPMICLPLLAKQYFPRQRRPAFTDWETSGRLCLLSWSMTTTRPITAFYSFLSTSQSSEIENETVNGKEAEAETVECENGKLFYAFNSISWEMLVNDYGLEARAFVLLHKRRMHPLRVQFNYTVRGQGIVTCNRDWPW